MEDILLQNRVVREAKGQRLVDTSRSLLPNKGHTLLASPLFWAFKVSRNITAARNRRELAKMVCGLNRFGQSATCTQTHTKYAKDIWSVSAVYYVLKKYIYKCTKLTTQLQQRLCPCWLDDVVHDAIF